MKIEHLNTYDGNGGAGRACLRLSKALAHTGNHSEVWVNYKFGRNPGIKSLSSDILNKGITAFAILLERHVSSTFTKKLKIPFSIPLWGRDISKHPALQDADIIHLHWVNHAFLRPRDLATLAALKKPIVWTFHDSNAFTGGCHVRYSCDHFEGECGNCPLLKSSHEHDISHKIWKAKHRAYQDLKFSIIAPSKWMAASIRRSKLLGNADIHVIPNTLETEIFKAYPKDSSKKHLELDTGKFIMLSGFMPSRNDLHKGTPYLIEALELLVTKNLINKDRAELIVFGNRNDKNVSDFPFKTTFLGTISNDEKLAICYSAADVFLTPSLEDNLPNTVMESLACGTPVVAFTTGGIPDMVEHKKNGYLAKYKSSDDLAEGIAWVYNHQQRQTLSEAARTSVEENFSEMVIADRHLQLYHRLLNKGTSDADWQPSLSVITVVYNNKRDIERTILSVINQTYSNIEYIIIDGESTDGTLDIIRKYENRISRLITEKDEGIYDAMNKGLGLATGDYILFMNSGDELYAGDTVEKVFASAPDADIYYGETEMYDEQWQSLGQRRHKAPERLSSKSFKYGMSVSHQAIYVRRSIISPYDRKYKLSADIDWILTALKRAEKIVNTKSYVAKYLVGGMSKKKHRESLLERFKIFSKHYGLLPNVFNHAIIASNLFFYYLKNRRTND
ncbi:glycosyltransferase [Pedobacter sp. P351]|uniref:glycosyltransferase n=1 Tax=Pedobacter superstes TaxID=3133441 RepID=UPI0030B26531